MRQRKDGAGEEWIHKHAWDCVVACYVESVCMWGGGEKKKEKKWNVFFIVIQEKRNGEREVRDRTWKLSSHKKKAGGCWELFVEEEDLTGEKVDSRF